MAAANYTITREELLAELDRQAEATLGISGVEFLKRYQAGTLEPTATVAHLAIFARLLND